MEDKVLSHRRCLLFLPPPASFSTSGSRVVTIEWLNDTSMDRTEARDPAIPTGPAHSRRSPDPRAGRAESEMPALAEDRADPYRLGLRQPGLRAKAQPALWERGRQPLSPLGVGEPGWLQLRAVSRVPEGIDSCSQRLAVL